MIEADFRALTIDVPEVAEEELLVLDEDTAESDDMIDDEGEVDEAD